MVQGEFHQMASVMGDHLDDLPGLRKCRAHGLRRFLRPAPYVARVWLGEWRPLRSP